MAVAKWIGTLAPAIQMGIIEDFNIYIVLMGVICSVFDIILHYPVKKIQTGKITIQKKIRNIGKYGITPSMLFRSL